MFKKCMMILALSVAGSVAGLLMGQSKAYACGNGVCGYFKDGNDSAWCNVLPDPSIKFSYGSGNCWLNSGGGNGHSLLFGDNTTAAFIGDMNTYLNAPGGNGGYNNNSTAGAAFLIDSMLGIDFHNGSTGNGINDARAQFGNWSSMVQNDFGVHQCATNSGQLACPGTTFGINWQYVPPYFCTSPVTTSGYDPFGAWDTPLYNTAPATCDHDWRASVPEIVFYWNNGNNSFHIGSQCGNAQSRRDIFPIKDRDPAGTILVTCVDPNTGLQSAHITFNDPDAATTAEFTVAGRLYGPYNPPSPQDINLLLPPTTDAYTKQTVIISVRDTGPLGDGTYHPMPAVQTAAPCVNYGCSLQPPNPSPLDPNMSYSLTPGVRVSVGQTPANPTIDITSIVRPTGGSYYSHGQIAAANNGGTMEATFAGIPSVASGGGGPGVYTVTWNLYTNGTLLKNCSDTFPVVYLPYANVYGGDVMVGASPDYSGGNSSCSADLNAGAYSWNNHTTAGFPGAGAQYAVQALTGITDFASALGSTNTPPHNLSFANTAGVTDNQGLFGGNFGALPNDCDFTSDLNASGVTHVNGNLTINATTLNASQRQIYEVTNGNVYISGDITYNTAGWGGVAQIPYFKLVVAGGNIYVSSAVKQLDGIYVAESSNANNGVIYTCAKGNGNPWNPKNDIAAGYYVTCNQTLTVNGAFVARQVQFGRTFGSVGNAKTSDNVSTSPSPDAEIFNYTPEIWLPRSADAPNGGYDTITGLPPVL